MCYGTAEAGMTAGPQGIFLALKKMFHGNSHGCSFHHVYLCSDAVQSQRTAESLVGYVKVSLLTCWYRVSELKKRVVLLFGSKTGCLRGKSSACVLRTSARNVTFSYQDTPQASKLDKNPVMFL